MMRPWIWLFFAMTLLGFLLGIGVHLCASQPVVASHVAIPPTILPTPWVVPTFTPTPRPSPTPTAKPKKRRGQSRLTRSVVRTIREAFLRGDLETANDVVNEQFRKEGGHSLSDRLLVAEVKYARCQRAFVKKEWGKAVRFCEEAVFHPKAKETLSKLHSRARKLYLEGYVMENTNPEAALQRYRESLVSAPSSSLCREKTIKRLKWIRGD